MTMRKLNRTAKKKVNMTAPKNKQDHAANPARWRAELRQKNAQLLGRHRGVLLLDLDCAALLAIEGGMPSAPARQ